MVIKWKLAYLYLDGGVKGAAHIGAIRAFEEEGIEFDYISGTSSGSIVATLYACGYNSYEMLEIFKKYSKKIKYVDIKNIFKLIASLIIKRKIFIDGLNSGTQIEKIINNVCNKKNIYNIKDIKKNLIIPSVDVDSGKIYMFSSKLEARGISNKITYVNDIDIGKAVRASCSYPGVFSPCKFKNIDLIDGGVRENIPWRETKLMGADKVISIIFEKDMKEKCNKNIVDVIMNSLDILSYELSTYEILGTDYLIKIKTKNISLLDTKKINYLYNLGYKITKEKILKIKKEIKI